MTDSAGVILLLTKGVLARPFCQLEVRKALELKRPLLLVHEADWYCGNIRNQGRGSRKSPGVVQHERVDCVEKERV